MGAWLSKLNGWKVYILGVGAILTLIGGMIGGQVDVKTGLEGIWAALMGMGLRHGITTTATATTGKPA